MNSKEQNLQKGIYNIMTVNIFEIFKRVVIIYNLISKPNDRETTENTKSSFTFIDLYVKISFQQFFLRIKIICSDPKNFAIKKLKHIYILTIIFIFNSFSSPNLSFPLMNA